MDTRRLLKPPDCEWFINFGDDQKGIAFGVPGTHPGVYDSLMILDEEDRWAAAYIASHCWRHVGNEEQEALWAEFGNAKEEELR